MKKEQKIEVVWRDIGNLIPYARNARTHDATVVARQVYTQWLAPISKAA